MGRCARAWRRPPRSAHDLGRGAVLGEERSDDPHRAVDVVEEVLEAGAQVVQPRIAVGRLDEPVLGAAAVAREPHVALPAVARERVALVEPELPLLVRGDELEHVPLADVPELVPRLDEVVAGVDVARVLEREREAAGLRVRRTGWEARPPSWRGPRRTSVHLAGVAAHPFLEHVDQCAGGAPTSSPPGEGGVSGSRDGAIGVQRALERLEPARGAVVHGRVGHDASAQARVEPQVGVGHAQEPDQRVLDALDRVLRPADLVPGPQLAELGRALLGGAPRRATTRPARPTCEAMFARNCATRWADVARASRAASGATGGGSRNSKSSAVAAIARQRARGGRPSRRRTRVFQASTS